MFSGSYFPVCVRLGTAVLEAPGDLSWLWRGVESALCTCALKICDCCFSFLHLSALRVSLSCLSFFLMMSPGVAASAVSSLN